MPTTRSAPPATSPAGGTPGHLGGYPQAPHRQYLADAGVNIEALYLAHDNRNVLVSTDNEAARAALA